MNYTNIIFTWFLEMISPIHWYTETLLVERGRHAPLLGIAAFNESRCNVCGWCWSRSNVHVHWIGLPLCLQKYFLHLYRDVHIMMMSTHPFFHTAPHCLHCPTKAPDSWAVYTPGIMYAWASKRHVFSNNVFLLNSALHHYSLCCFICPESLLFFSPTLTILPKYGVFQFSEIAWI